MCAGFYECKKNKKGLESKSKLTTKLIDKLGVYYELMIHRNVNSLNNMYKVVQTTIFHKNSTDQ